jgi:hypothetical protein
VEAAGKLSFIVQGTCSPGPDVIWEADLPRCLCR